jgi:hypothetical protein
MASSDDEDDIHVCGITGGLIEHEGCEKEVCADDTIMIGNTSFCIECGEKYIKQEQEEKEEKQVPTYKKCEEIQRKKRKIEDKEREDDMKRVKQHYNNLSQKIKDNCIKIMEEAFQKQYEKELSDYSHIETQKPVIDYLWSIKAYKYKRIKGSKRIQLIV